MSECYVGEIRMFGGNFAPLNWALCNGQLLSISQNDALYTLIGTTFGGDGVSTFALPNLQGRIPVDQGQGNGLSNRILGEMAGSEEVTLTTPTIPGHSHMLMATLTDVNSASAGANVLPGKPTVTNARFYTMPVEGKADPTPVQMSGAACMTAGGNQPHDNIMPSLCTTFIIALYGIYPSRN